MALRACIVTLLAIVEGSILSEATWTDIVALGLSMQVVGECSTLSLQPVDRVGSHEVEG